MRVKKKAFFLALVVYCLWTLAFLIFVRTRTHDLLRLPTWYCGGRDMGKDSWAWTAFMGMNSSGVCASVCVGVKCKIVRTLFTGDSFCRISQPFGIDFCCPGGWVRRRVKNQRFWAPGPGNQNIAQIAFSSIVNTHRFDGFTFWQFGVPNISDFGVSEKTIKSTEKLWKSNEKLWKAMQSHEKPWKAMTSHEK